MIARWFGGVRPTLSERAASLPADDLVPDPDVVMDRAFTLPAPPDLVWPWIAQLGKRRAGWYLPQSVERFVPRSRRALRTIDPVRQRLRPGDVIPDYGGRHETLQVVIAQAPATLAFRSRRGRMSMSWEISLRPLAVDESAARPTIDEPTATRVHLRLRLGPVRRKWLARTAGELLDVLTVAGLAAGLRERVAR